MPVWNFSAGPARVADPVMVRAKSELSNWQGCGVSVMEMSHRSAEFDSIIKAAEADLRELMKIPDNYDVLFMQGGGSAQFASVPLNLLNTATWNAPVDYVVTGAWSKKAYEEAQRYAKTVNLAADGKPSKYTTVPPVAEWSITRGAPYLYYCSNETIHGVEMSSVPDVPEGTTLVCDMSSHFLSRPVDVSKYGLIYAGAQKNCGIAGVTVVIIRKDLVGNALPCTPSMLDYKVMADNKSLYNTPPCFAIYMAGLVFRWLLDNGGLEDIDRKNAAKADLLYGAIDASNGFYSSPVDPQYRSRMNVPFRVKEDEALEKLFLAEAKKQGLTELKGHRSVGGCRASIYNAMPLEGVQALTTFMQTFMQQHTTTAPAAAPATGGVDVDRKPERRLSRGRDLGDMKVLISDKTDDSAVRMFGDAGIQADMKTGLKEDELCAIIGEYHALVVRSGTTVTPKIIEAATNLRIIGRAGVGVDNINLPAATEKGVIVVNSPQGNTISAAEHTWGMLLAAARQIPPAHASLKIEGKWDRKSYMGVELEGKTLGILGLGNVGRKVARYGQAFGMTVNAYDPFVTPEQGAKLGAKMMDCDAVLATSDFLTLHLPAIKETLKMINARSIATMKPGVILANVARGECVDEADLAEALKTGHVRAAALDVFAPEPLAADSPLRGLPNVILTPHLGASTMEAQVKVAVDVVEQIIEVFRGGPARSAVNIPSMKPHLIEPVQPLLNISEKLGRVVAQLATGSVSQVTVSYAGACADRNVSPLTTAVLKGLLDVALAETVNFVNAPGIAKSRGLAIEEKRVTECSYQNLITVTAEGPSGSTKVSGTHMEHGDRIVDWDGLPTDLEPKGWMLFIQTTDTPGTIGRVGMAMGDGEININSMEVCRYSKGERAGMVLSIDDEPSDDLVANLPNIDGIRGAFLVYA